MALICLYTNGSSIMLCLVASTTCVVSLAWLARFDLVPNNLLAKLYKQWQLS